MVGTLFSFDTTYLMKKFFNNSSLIIALIPHLVKSLIPYSPTPQSLLLPDTWSSLPSLTSNTSASVLTRIANCGKMLPLRVAPMPVRATARNETFYWTTFLSCRS